MIAAVAAVFASAQVEAATDTVRHTWAAGRAVRGSSMWCSTSPPRRQRRAAVDDVARPPSRIVTTWLGPSGGSPGSAVLSWTRMRQPSPGGSPATAVSPPRLTSTPQPSSPAIRAADRSADHPFTVAPRSSWTPAGTVSSPVARSTRTDRHPGIIRTRTAAPAALVLSAWRAVSGSGPGGLPGGVSSAKSRS